MLESVEIRGYRGFELLRMEGFTRVNLILGANNAGKTTVLDALELWSVRADSRALLRSLHRRSEVQSRLPEGSATGSRQIGFDAAQLFRGRAIHEGSQFTITANDGQVPVTCRVVVEGSDAARQTLKVEAIHGHASRQVRHAMAYGAVHARHSDAEQERVDAVLRPFVFVPASAMGARDRAALWDRIVGSDDEDRVRDALRCVEPLVDRVLFTVGDRGVHGPAPFLRLVGVPERVPLGNLGHGASRLLDLAMLMTQARGGALFVDEVEFGLHHSVMTKVWNLILETARRLDIQVFATTHSADCLRALASLYRSNPDIRDEVSVHRLEAGVDRAERFSLAEVEIAERADLELRGLG